ncbi:MAG: FkbM family methyltransferase [Deltaproteobacteria bacterium]|nr:FkbM family methyltransferase [Deltaproteobacteria bacterium]
MRSARLFKALVLNHVVAGTEHCHAFEPNLVLVVDIGANRGQFSLAVKHGAPETRVIAFEPLTVAAAIFRNVFLEDASVSLHQTAIGPQAGETVIHVSAAEDSSSLLPISPLQERLFPGTHEIRKEKVRIGPLSDFVIPEDIVPPAMLKLDVQGYELEALRGCEDLLGRFSHVYVECSFVELYFGQALADDVIAWLKERRWCLSGIYNMTYDRKGRSIQADFLFENSLLKDGMLHEER